MPQPPRGRGHKATMADRLIRYKHMVALTQLVTATDPDASKYRALRAGTIFASRVPPEDHDHKLSRRFG